MCNVFDVAPFLLVCYRGNTISATIGRWSEACVFRTSEKSVTETLCRLVGRPRLLLAAAYLEFLLKLTYERRIGLVVQVASHHERLSAFLCRLLNDAYRCNAVGFGQREVGRCKYEVVELRHKQRSCLLTSRQRILSDAYRTLAREYADAVFAAF